MNSGLDLHNILLIHSYFWVFKFKVRPDLILIKLCSGLLTNLLCSSLKLFVVWSIYKLCCWFFDLLYKIKELKSNFGLFSHAKNTFSQSSFFKLLLTNSFRKLKNFQVSVIKICQFWNLFFIKRKYFSVEHFHIKSCSLRIRLWHWKKI